MANHDAPAVSLSQKVERYFSMLILFINGQSIVNNDVNRWQTDFWPPNHWRIIFPTMSPLFSQMSPLFLEPWDIVPSYEISRQNTAYVLGLLTTIPFAPAFACGTILVSVSYWLHFNSQIFGSFDGSVFIPLLPGRVAQSVGHLTRKSGVLGSIPGLATYFRFSFRFFKKGSCQLLAKVCARSTG